VRRVPNTAYFEHTALYNALTDGARACRRANGGTPQHSISAGVVDLQHVAAKFLLGLV
jgi:methylphosphotriester-DNA--protein-cysteine methyltransferase